MSRTPYEVRLEIIQEARKILQAQAESNKSLMPTTDEIIKHAEHLNKFVSNRPGND